MQAEGRQLIRDALARQEQLGHPAVVERELSFRRMGLLGRRWVTVRKGCYPVTEFTQRESSTHGRGQAPIFLTSDGQIHIHAYVEEFDEFARRCFEARSPTIAQYRPAVFDAVIAGLRELSR